MALFQNRFIGTTPLATNWTFTWWATSSSAIATVNAAAVTWANDFWTGLFDGYTTADTQMTTVSTGEIEPTTGQQQRRQDTSVALSGVGVGSNLSAQTALVVSLRTSLANRSGRGRMFLPPMSTEALDASGRPLGTFLSDVLAGVAAAWSTFGSTGQLVLYSRTLRTSTVVDSVDSSNLFEVQRGRIAKATRTRTSENV